MAHPQDPIKNKVYIYLPHGIEFRHGNDLVLKLLTNLQNLNRNVDCAMIFW